MTDPTTPIDPATTQPPDDRLNKVETLVTDDRLCLRCGFNLCGQAIVREPRYNLLIARCPHCQQVDPIEAFPPFTHWVTRWSVVLAAFWMLVLTAFAGGTLISLVAGTSAATDDATRSYSGGVRDQLNFWTNENRTAQDPPNWAYEPETFAEFWSAEGDRVIEQLGSVWTYIDWEDMTFMLLPCGFGVALGTFWSIALIHWKRRHLSLAILGLLLLLQGAVGLMWWIGLQLQPSSASHIGWIRFQFPMLMINFAVTATVFWLASIFGRSVIRGLVRIMIPPRFRGALSFLWTSDGKPPPAPATEYAAGRSPKQGSVA